MSRTDAIVAFDTSWAQRAGRALPEPILEVRGLGPLLRLRLRRRTDWAASICFCRIATANAPYSLQGVREIERVDERLGWRLFRSLSAFRYTDPPYAFAAAAASRGEAAELQDRFWYARPARCAPGSIRKATICVGTRTFWSWTSHASTTIEPVRTCCREFAETFEGGVASGEERGTPTLFIEGVVPAAATTQRR